MVSAQIIGLNTTKVNLYAKYASASKWGDGVDAAADGWQRASSSCSRACRRTWSTTCRRGQRTSKHFKFRVVDLPSVKAMQVTYHYPKWTGMQEVSEEQAGRPARAWRARMRR